MQFGQARHQRGNDEGREYLVAADGQRQIRRGAPRASAADEIAAARRRRDWHRSSGAPAPATKISCTEPNTTKCDPTRSLAVTRQSNATKESTTRGAPVTCVVQSAQSNLAAPRAPLRPGEIVGDMRLIVAQHIDAEHAVLEHRGDHRAQMMNAHQQRRLRRIGRHRHHGGYRHAVPPRDAVGGHDVDGTRGMAHAVQESLPQTRIDLGWVARRLSCRSFAHVARSDTPLWSLARGE